TVTAPGAGTPTGTVQFVADGSDVLGSAPVLEGTATLSGITSLIPGTHAVTATYSGDAAFNPSTSPPIDQVVRGYPTTTTVLSSVNPSRVGQPVVFSATVASDGGGTPTGTVQFGIDGQPLSTVPLVSGTATTAPLSLTVGTHALTAVYQGTPSYTTSADALHGVTVGKADSTTTVGSSPNPST